MTNKAKFEHDELGDIEVLCDLHHIYLKPICKVHLTVQISGLSCIGAQGRCLSTWEVSEKLRQLCPSLLSPPIQMKVTGATVDFVRFVVELNSRVDVRRVIKAADSQRIKLSGFPQTLRVRAGDAPIDCPRKHDWEAFFRDAKDMNELVPGERPDTVVISKLPVRWFARSSSTTKFQPDPEIVEEVFKIYGKIRRIDIPMLDPCQNPQLLTKMGLSVDHARTFLSDFGYTLSAEPDAAISSSSSIYGHDGFGKMAPSTIKPLFFDEKPLTSVDSASPLTFTVFIQYTDYSGFAAAMEALRGKKLIYAPNDKNNADSPKFFSAEIKVNFDRSKHLSDLSVRRRKAARIQLEAAAIAAEEEARRLRAEREARTRELAAQAEAEAQLAAKRAEEKKREETRKEELLRALAKRIKRERAKRARVEAADKVTEREKKRHKGSLYLSLGKHHREREKAISKDTKDGLPVSTSSIAIQTSPERSHSSGKHQSRTKLISEMRARSPVEATAERMREKLLQKRELQLRARLLSASCEFYVCLQPECEDTNFYLLFPL
uniref:A kinase anchor protein 17A n=1 Tax=Echinococcus granulosus TaxID=6210 RepID=A0A068WJ38_ECHGR|nr:A kinase anchor protein 17A [Echinococcus granulosus]